MLITAEQKNSRQSDRKVLLVANAVKKLSVEAALRQLSVMEKKASVVVMKVLRQAIANAIHNHGLTLADLRIQSIIVGGGTSYKRFRAVSRGRAHSILKRTCHVRVTLTTQAPVAKAEKAVTTPAVEKTATTKSETVKVAAKSTPAVKKTKKASK
jgi:large subunit ribosomal protein L22